MIIPVNTIKKMFWFLRKHRQVIRCPIKKEAIKKIKQIIIIVNFMLVLKAFLREIFLVLISINHCFGGVMF